MTFLYFNAKFSNYLYYLASKYYGSAGVILHTNLVFLTILQDDDKIGAIYKDVREYVPINEM